MVSALRNLSLWLLRARIGFALLGITCGIGGFIIVVIQLFITGVFARMGDQAIWIIATMIGYSSLAALVGGVIAFKLQAIRLGWWRDGQTPTFTQADKTIRLPLEVALILTALWLPGVVIVTVVVGHLLPSESMVYVDAQVLLGAVASAGMTFLVVDKVLSPVMDSVSEVVRPASHPSATVAVRLAITWLITSGVPMASLLITLSDPRASTDQQIRGATYVAFASLVIGAVVLVLLVRAVASPLSRLRAALQDIGRGNLDRRVRVDSITEIGLLEATVNDMSESLRDRARLREVFGRHVGADVADRAMAGQLDLSGEFRDATALFVDIVGSTDLAHRLEPTEFVERLNRLLAIVVDATTANQGLVNKFEGDAALCIFGAPIELADDAGAALRAARRIRDEVRLVDEFDIGIGVARGTVFAGGIGAATRMEYTVIGDPVNEAARLTEAAKGVATRILVSQAVVESADPSERELWVRHGSLKLRGHEHETKAWTDNRGHGAPVQRLAADQLAAERIRETLA